MHSEFSEWYRDANLLPTDEILKSRWKGIEYLSKVEFNAEDIIGLIQLFYGIEKTNSIKDTFIKCFTDIDSAFQKKNKNEISILAGTLLLELVVNDSDKMGDLISCALMSVSFNNNLPIARAIMVEAHEIFTMRSAEIREKIFSNKNSKFLPHNEDIINHLQKIVEGKITFSSETATLLIDYFKKNDNYIQDIEAEKNIYKEDSQILWWITNSWCDHFNKNIKSLSPEEGCLIIGKEYADIISILPGPYASKAILNNMSSKFSNFDKIDLGKVVNSLDKKTRESIVAQYSSDIAEDIVPVLMAISKSLEVDTKDDWYPLFKKIKNIHPSDILMSPTDYAYQMYIECLTVKAFNCYEDGR